MKMDGSICYFFVFKSTLKLMISLCFWLVCLFDLYVCVVLACFALYTVVTIAKPMLLCR